ncbi:MAG: aldo/keto reductase family protein [Gemmatimonadota bacterium]|nr:MAG: aldo/keto reductase family protein [Gemmatimonadota bacterium]
MQYRSLGKSGLKVSAISLGSWLTLGHKMGADVAVRSVRRAFELGVNLFDTANMYDEGQAEIVLGKALAPIQRQQYVLATKAYFPVGPGPNDRGLSRKHIFEQVHLSLRRLGTDYVDLFQCHRYDDETPLDETLRAIDDLIAQGKVLYGGVSVWSAANIADAMKLARELGLRRLVSNQPQYHILRRDIETNGVLDVCAREGLGLLVYSPLARGVLTGKYTSVEDVPSDSRAADAHGRQFMGPWFSAEGLQVVQSLKQIAETAGLSLPEMALAWCLRRPEVSSAIIGATKVEHVEQNAAAAEITLGDDVLAAIDQIAPA